MLRIVFRHHHQYHETRARGFVAGSRKWRSNVIDAGSTAIAHCDGTARRRGGYVGRSKLRDETETNIGERRMTNGEKRRRTRSSAEGFQRHGTSSTTDRVSEGVALF